MTFELEGGANIALYRRVCSEVITVNIEAIVKATYYSHMLYESQNVDPSTRTPKEKNPVP